MKEGKNQRQGIFGTLQVLGIGWVVVGSVLAGVLFGWLAYKYLYPTSLFLVGFIILGVLAGLYQAYRIIIKVLK
ncbi:MAG: hypothetical protein AMS15_00235 [Planctomycetes bacterium DG_23]|nr:MAG: hypothetical protein AMS15_00235 [Planctomycetes bacterium DG_23]